MKTRISLCTAARMAASALIVLALIAGDVADLSAQRGGGGRGGIRVMTLTSSAFQDGGMIPVKHAQPGHDVSPPLDWSGAPDSTVSFVLIMHDIDAVTGDGTNDSLHWMVWGIPGTMISLPEGMPQGPTIAMSAPVQVAGGPAAPSTGPAHHYVFELYALDTNINVLAGIASTAVTRQAVWDAMKTHIRGKAVLVGRFRREAP